MQLLLSVSEWRKWFLRQLIGGGIHNPITEKDLKKIASRNYDVNLDVAISEMMDNGIVMAVESSKEKKYLVNYDKLDYAQRILNSGAFVKEEQNIIIQDYMAEPEGYTYWFDNNDMREFKKQCTYRIYIKNSDKQDYAAQIITKSVTKAKTIHMGSLNDSNSYISRLWQAVQEVAGENKDGIFILQNLQDKDRVACGNNRQRGKIALVIFKKLGYILPIGTKGNSTLFKLSGKAPYIITLDEILKK